LLALPGYVSYQAERKRVAHTRKERVPKKQLIEAIEIDQKMVKELWKQELK
jgi:hypothetical protein